MMNHTISNRYLVESYNNGYNWFRVYSDGWVEQGGYTGLINTNENFAVNLLKPMPNTNYIIIIGQMMGDFVGYLNQGLIVYDTVTTTGFSVSNRRFASENSYGVGIFWEVKGMGA